LATAISRVDPRIIMKIHPQNQNNPTRKVKRECLIIRDAITQISRQNSKEFIIESVHFIISFKLTIMFFSMSYLFYDAAHMFSLFTLSLSLLFHSLFLCFHSNYYCLLFFDCLVTVLPASERGRSRAGGSTSPGHSCNKTADHSRRTWVQPITALLQVIPANRTADHSRRTWVQPITAFI
jgi:hypothetical protein